MISRTLVKLARMDAAEIVWRTTTTATKLVGRAQSRLVAPRWSRTALAGALAPIAELNGARAALRAGRWAEAHRALAQYFARAPRRFTISPQSKPDVVDRIRRVFPGAKGDAVARAEHIVAGEYDLLGYRGLRFGHREPSVAASEGTLPDWAFDPVHDRRPPLAFWSTVPYLDPASGDHKIIWELNRHQHWLALGRAYSLSGDERYRARWVAELGSWMAANPPLLGVNWSSMLELGFRSIAWIWALALFVDDSADSTFDPQGASSPWLVDLLVGLDRQLTHIERNLSHYFSPNTHLTGEALALYVSGRALPELAASSRRAALGRTILLREIERQIAADGGHRERSAHYHRYTLDFYSFALVIARQTGDAVAPQLQEAVARLAAAAQILADDRGRIPHIGDDDGGSLTPLTGRNRDDIRDSLAIAAALLDRPDLQIDGAPEEALWILGPEITVADPPSGLPRLTSGALRETGYYVSRSGRGDHLLIDGGPHGYQNGGHAHADALSLTLTVKGVPLLIDPGTGCYTMAPVIRDRMRSSAMHNTVTVDHRSQSLSSGPFHWSHVAETTVHRWRVHKNFDYFDGSHDGYRPTDHRRCVFAMHGDLVVVADFIGGSGFHTAAVHWHLDPQWRVETCERGASFTRNGERLGLSVSQGTVDAISADQVSGLGWWSPEYGRIERNTTLRITQSAATPFWLFSVFDLDPDNPVVRVDSVPTLTAAGALNLGAAVRITRAASVDRVLFAQSPALASEPAARFGAVAIPVTRQMVQTGEVATDAQMLFYRSSGATITRVALVDGSLARFEAGGISLPAIVPTYFSARPTNFEPRTQDACAALPVS